MAIILLLKWWYGSGWLWLASVYKERMADLSRNFSVLILLKTLFSPWKQLQTKATLRNFMQTVVDNTVSRFIGFLIRFFVLIAASLTAIFMSFVFGILLMVWAFIPLLIVILPFVTLIIGGDNAG